MSEQMAAFSSFIIRVEDEASLVERFQQHDPHRWLFALLDCGERNRSWIGDQRSIGFLRESEDLAKPVDRIRWNQLIPRHRWIDFVDPTQNPTRKASNLGQPSVSKLLGGKSAAHPDPAVENCLPALVETGNLVGDAIERDKSSSRYVANVPLEWLSHIDYLQIVAGGESFRELQRLNLLHRTAVLVHVSATAELVVIDQLFDLVSAASGTFGITSDVDGSKLHAQRVDREQSTGQRIAKTERHFDRFGSLNRTDETGHDAEDACLRATRHELRRWRLAEQTPVARPVRRSEH